MALIHCCQQTDIFQRVLAGKTGHIALSALEFAGLAVLGNQPRDLLAGIAADLHQVADQDTLQTHFILDKTTACTRCSASATLSDQPSYSFLR